jgi:hypothetical protein
VCCILIGPQQTPDHVAMLWLVEREVGEEREGLAGVEGDRALGILQARRAEEVESQVALQAV